MYTIYDPCPDETDESGIVQRMDSQSSELSKVVESVYTIITQRLADNVTALMPIIKLFKQRCNRRIKQTEKQLDTVRAFLYDRMLSMVTENRIRLNQVASELERFQNEQDASQARIPGQAGEVAIPRAEQPGSESRYTPTEIGSGIRPDTQTDTPLQETGIGALTDALTQQPSRDFFADRQPASGQSSGIKPLPIGRESTATDGQSDFPVDLDQPRAFRFWPGDSEWRNSVIEYEGQWLRDYMLIGTAREWVEYVDRVEPREQSALREILVME